MLTIGIIREGKIPPDNRVALTPAQCKWLTRNKDRIRIIVQHSETRCYKDEEYIEAGIEVKEDLNECDIILGIKEVPINMLLKDKTFFFFSHTKKKQPYNRKLFHAMMDLGISLIDYECLRYRDGQRILGFGLFAGIVGAHNGLMAYGKRTGHFNLSRVYHSKDYRELIHTYFGVRLPQIKIAVTGSGRVAHGIMEIMNALDIREVDPEEYLKKEYEYPVYCLLKGKDLYLNREWIHFKKDEFHKSPDKYKCLFKKYISTTDILLNGIYWEKGIPPLFEMEDIASPDFRIQTISDITDDPFGSVPCNLGDSTITDPVYGINRETGDKTLPYLKDSLDIVAVGNLPNELPRDASRFFGNQFIKYILPQLIQPDSLIIEKAKLLEKGKLTERYEYLQDYAQH